MGRFPDRTGAEMVTNDLDATFDPFTVAKHMWALFYVDTESFDRRFTGHPSKHYPYSWIVADPEGRAQSARYARELDLCLRRWLKAYEIDSWTSYPARLNVEQMRFAEQAALAARIKLTESLTGAPCVEIDGQKIAMPPGTYFNKSHLLSMSEDVGGREAPQIVAPKIFGFEMGASETTEEGWALAFGEWNLFIRPALWPNQGKSWWEVSAHNGGTTIKSDYADTHEDAAQAIEDYLTELGNLVAEWQSNAMKVAGAER